MDTDIITRERKQDTKEARWIYGFYYKLMHSEGLDEIGEPYKAVDKLLSPIFYLIENKKTSDYFKRVSEHQESLYNKGVLRRVKQ